MLLLPAPHFPKFVLRSVRLIAFPFGRIQAKKQLTHFDKRNLLQAIRAAACGELTNGWESFQMAETPLPLNGSGNNDWQTSGRINCLI